MKSLLAFVVVVNSVSAWWDHGHLLTAKRAYDLLAEESPNILVTTASILAPLKQHYPDITATEGDWPFVECATVADVIKNMGYKWQSPWHFTN